MQGMLSYCVSCGPPTRHPAVQSLQVTGHQEVEGKTTSWNPPSGVAFLLCCLLGSEPFQANLVPSSDPWIQELGVCDQNPRMLPLDDRPTGGAYGSLCRVIKRYPFLQANTASAPAVHPEPVFCHQQLHTHSWGTSGWGSVPNSVKVP